MKRTRTRRNLICGLSVLVVFLTSCAAETPVIKGRKAQPPRVGSKAQPVVQAQRKEEIIHENGKDYRLVATPFGYVKQEVAASEAPAGPVSIGPAGDTGRKPGDKIALKQDKPAPDKSERPGRQGQADKPEKRKPPEKGGQSVILNFDDADIDEVVRTMADLLKITYILGPGIRGNVTIHTAGKLRVTDLMPVFYQILEANGLTAVQEGRLYRIVRIKEASRMPIGLGIGRDQKDVPPGDRIIVQIVPLTYISPAEMTKILTPFVSRDGAVLSHEGSNTLVVVDKGINILKILRLVAAFDVDVFERFNYRFYPLTYMDAADAAKLLESTFAARAEKKGDVRFVEIDRLNMVLAVSPIPGIFSRIRAFIEQLDVPSDVAEPKIYVYFVKNGESKNLADLLNRVFTKGSSNSKQGGAKKSPSGKENKAKYAGNPFAKKEEQPGKSKEIRETAPSSSLLQGTLKGEVTITADEVRNALIIQAIPSDYRIIENILNKIDVLPRQVLIEVMIAEISLDTAHQLGVEWNYLKGRGAPGMSVLSASAGSAGLQYVIGQTERWSATLSALASKNKVNILSSPSILASDNKEASINISTEVPVASAQYQYTTGTEPVIQTNIQYRNTGLILTVTPHINDRGLVTMVIKQEVSDQSQNVQVGDTTYPSFFKRSVDTTLTVRHGQTIVIGGLIKQTKSDGVSGVPGLVRIPVLRWLFGKEQRSSDKSELILLITPHVITSLTDIDAVTEEFKAKVGTLTQYLGR